MNGHRRVLVSYLDMLLHYPPPFFKGDAVPFPLLGEGIDEEIVGADGLRVSCLAEILRRSNHGQIGMGSCEILSEAGLQDLGVEPLSPSIESVMIHNMKSASP